MISFSVLIENGLRLPLGSVKMVFQQNVSYAFGCTKLFSKQMQDQEIVVLQQEEGPLIPPGPKRVISWACNFKVPHSPPSNLGAAGCNLIKLTYCIIVTVAKFVNLQIVVPIHVGTPVRDDTVNWEEVSLAYGAHLRRSLSEHSLAAWTTSDTSSSSWSLMDSGDDADRTACASSTQG
ncbi:uncharacterized protein LOC118437446 isoform X1 [Folsomia candida]|uniref:uncharacterized protein LOC118437446 isoform X1 n=1 Tax=Folsomia candida TaxID=158441 RepID=UPI0016051F70|nr:uncharacterized protein LOC118437446 isoform X1 [Folsomia candida]XP_035712344.1 uncharacterized protein LOC118437446 isoform X1 [Folsomia candida]